VHDSVFTRQNIALFSGLLMFIMAVGGTFAGKLPGRFSGVSSRAKEPGQYWSALAMYYLASMGFLWYGLYLAAACSK
jgi:hypothetical protein